MPAWLPAERRGGRWPRPRRTGDTPASEGQLTGAAAVVVAVVGGGPGIGSAAARSGPGSPPSRPRGSRGPGRSREAGRVLVVEPVLDVERCRRDRRSSRSRARPRSGRAWGRQSTTWTKAAAGSPVSDAQTAPASGPFAAPAAAAGAEVHRQRAHPLLVDDLRGASAATSAASSGPYAATSSGPRSRRRRGDRADQRAAIARPDPVAGSRAPRRRRAARQQQRDEEQKADPLDVAWPRSPAPPRPLSRADARRGRLTRWRRARDLTRARSGR